MRYMNVELNVENLSEAFGFSVSPAFESLIRSALEESAEAPCLGPSKCGLSLGGPLYSILGGSAQSLRCPRTPPEFFPFAVSRGRYDTYVGFVVDDPQLEGPPNTLFGVLVPEASGCSGVVARDEAELMRWLSAHEEQPGSFGVRVKSKDYDPDDVAEFRRGALTYRTADQLGAVVPEENAPFSLIHEEFRCNLIERREFDKVRDAGRSALRLEAPGAALALARDLTWWLGHRDHWYQLATELYEGAYTQLGRPLLTRIARREWARLYGRNA